MSGRLKNFITIVILGMAGGSIYCLPYLKYVFYDQMIQAMHINDQQLGFIMSVYAIACILVYIPGGIISDNVSSKKCIIGSLFVTTILTIVYAMFPSNYPLSLAIWFLLAFTTIFLCWPAIMKTIRFLGKDIGVGIAYGTYYAINGLTGGIINTIALSVYGNLGKNDRFFWAVMAIAFFTVLIPIILIFLLKDTEKDTTESSSDGVKLSDIGVVLKNPQIWLISIIMFCTYSLFTGITYFNPYLANVYHIPTGLNETLTIVRTFVFMVLAPISGYMADKYFHSTLKWFLVGIFCTFIPVVFLMGNVNTLSPTMAIVLTLIPAFFTAGMYSIMFSIINECKIPMKVAGTAIGVVSIFSFLPDLVIHAFFGKLLDTYHLQGWIYIFSFMLCVSVVAFITCIYLIRRKKAMAITTA